MWRGLLWETTTNRNQICTDMEIRFDKIKHDKDGKIHIEYSRLTPAGSWDELMFRSSDEPRPEFKEALDALAVHVVEMCEMPEFDHEDHKYTIRNVSFSYGGENEVMGVTITALRSLDGSNSPLVLNTPHFIAEPYNEGGDDSMGILSSYCNAALKTLKAEAQLYLDGHRKQMDLFASDQNSDTLVLEME